MRTSSDHVGDRFARIRSWDRPGQGPGAHLVLTDHRHRPPLERVERWVDDLRTAGYATVRTGAMEPGAAAPFLASGFAVAQRLALLQADAPFELVHPRGRMRALRSELDLEDAAAIDAAAFGPVWSFDAAAIEEAQQATPAHRSRLAVDPDGRPVAYVVSGRAGRNGFLQRLAVHPDAQRLGYGWALVCDALRWLRRWRVQSALVNTEVGNDPALQLYQRAGFRRLPDELLVLERLL